MGYEPLVWRNTYSASITFASTDLALSMVAVHRLSPVWFAICHGMPQCILGSGLIDYSQKMTVAAMQMAEKNVWAHRS